MRLSRFSLVLAAATAALASFARAFERAIIGTLRFIIGLVPYSPPTMAFDGGFQTNADILGTPFDPSVVQAKRHEAGVSRRAAARNT